MAVRKLERPVRGRARRPVTGGKAEASFRNRARAALLGGGLRWTQQREVLLEVIERAAHLDADEIYQLARERDARISLSTVYRTLTLLKSRGLVNELHLSEEHHHYEAKTGDAADEHYHFVCTSCGKVEEFLGGAAGRLRAELAREHGFLVQSIDLDVAGLCAACAPRAG